MYLIVLNLACFLYFIIKDYKVLIKEIDKIKLDILTNKRKSINNIGTNNIHGEQKGKMRVNTNDIKSNLKGLNNKDFKKDGRYLTITSKPKFILPPIYKGYFNYNKFYRRNIIPYVKGKSSSNSNNYFLTNKVSIQNNLLCKLNYFLMIPQCIKFMLIKAHLILFINFHKLFILQLFLLF